MSQHYSNPERANDVHALPNVETFQVKDGKIDGGHEVTYEDGSVLDDGWYWQACFPGCLPDGEPNGPFTTEAEAVEAARDDA